MQRVLYRCRFEIPSSDRHRRSLLSNQTSVTGNNYTVTENVESATVTLNTTTFVSYAIIEDTKI